MADFSKGLEGVIADESKICKINADPAGLFYMGYSVQDLAENCKFLEVTYLLLNGVLPTKAQLSDFEGKVNQLRSIPDEITQMIKLFPKTASPMDVLQASVAALGIYTQPFNHTDNEAVAQAMMTLVAQIPTIVSTFYRHQQGWDDVTDTDELDYASYFLYKVTNKKPDAAVAKVFDQCLILHAEHSANASTFTGRVVASTLADVHASISAAVGALSGPLHGGANEHAVLMAKEVGAPENAKDWVTTQLSQKKKIYGFGHRVYRDVDPRATVLEGLFQNINIPENTAQKFKTLQAIRDAFSEAMAKSGKALHPNVDLFSGTLYEGMGIPLETYTSVFAIARMAGWGAHIVELWKDNRLYRPRLHYVGEYHESVPDITGRG
jgi:citrate synthase